MTVEKTRRAQAGLVTAVLLTALGGIDGALGGTLDAIPPGFPLALGAAFGVAGWWAARNAAKERHLLLRLLEGLGVDHGRHNDVSAADLPADARSIYAGITGELQASRNAHHALHVAVVDLVEEVRAVSKRCRKALDSTANTTQEAEAAVNELVHAVQEVAHSAAAAADSTHQAAKEADNGKVAMTEAMGAMSSLGDHIGRAGEAVTRLGKETQNIGAVLDVIRGIAEQTNLLALNAAIEAARAGEQGRGFAVVADEVRTLASRTQRSTQEIRQMIERLQGEAQSVVGVMSEGTSQASVVEEFIENACVALAEIGGAVTTIDGMTTQIASAAEEQHAGVRSLQGMVATRGARGAALEQALADLIRIADALEAANAQPV